MGPRLPCRGANAESALLVFGCFVICFWIVLIFIAVHFVLKFW